MYKEDSGDLLIDSQNVKLRECSRAQFCEMDLQNREQYIDWTNKYSLKNWIISLDLYCGSSFEIGFFGSCFFIGYLSSCLIFPPLADVYGRKIFVIAVCIA